ncbi:MAG TPA: nucleotidyltransferase domain-containing protein [Roseiarcus sp.]|nr:nucleotidyltransferase domain-containing protein [Roseiarcus sp.]
MFMDWQAIIAKLRENQAALKARGVSHAALFGSRVRGESRPGSDIDIFVEIEPSFAMDVFQYVGVVHAIEDLFAERVDVSNRAAMKAHVRPSAERDAIYAF